MQNEDRIDNVLRPLRFADFVGQDRVKDNLQIAVGAARAQEVRDSRAAMGRLRGWSLWSSVQLTGAAFARPPFGVELDD